MNLFAARWVGLALAGVSALGVSSARADDPYAAVIGAVNRDHLVSLLKDLTGVNEVHVGGEAFKISERYTPASKEKFRKYWAQYYQTLGIPVTEMAYPTVHRDKSGEAMGHNLEAVLPGATADSIVIIVHYDSMGPEGAEASNPGVDDDMTGMATQLETARILAGYRGRLHYTVRFVASDYEEWGKLEGARVYAQYLKSLAAAQGFRIVAAIDDEQSGWNCAAEGQCIDGSTQPKMLINDCSTNGQYASKDLSGALAAVSDAYQGLPVVTECAGEDSDHYAFWELGVPAVEFGEYSWQKNDHFDERGGDVYERIDTGYFFEISRVGVAFVAKTVGIL